MVLQPSAFGASQKESGKKIVSRSYASLEFNWDGNDFSPSMSKREPKQVLSLLVSRLRSLNQKSAQNLAKEVEISLAQFFPVLYAIQNKDVKHMVGFFDFVWSSTNLLDTEFWGSPEVFEATMRGTINYWFRLEPYFPKDFPKATESYYYYLIEQQRLLSEQLPPNHYGYFIGFTNAMADFEVRFFRNPGTSPSGGRFDCNSLLQNSRKTPKRAQLLH
jgi:hypothetical protein